MLYYISIYFCLICDNFEIVVDEHPVLQMLLVFWNFCPLSLKISDQIVQLESFMELFFAAGMYRAHLHEFEHLAQLEIICYFLFSHFQDFSFPLQKSKFPEHSVSQLLLKVPTCVVEQLYYIFCHFN